MPAVYRLVDGPPCSSQAVSVVAVVIVARPEQTKETAPAEAGGYIMDGGYEAKTEILAEKERSRLIRGRYPP